jgi:hypothetical protein
MDDQAAVAAAKRAIDDDLKKSAPGAGGDLDALGDALAYRTQRTTSDFPDASVDPTKAGEYAATTSLPGSAG